MSESLKMVAIAFLLIIVCFLVNDYGQSELIKQHLKDTLDLSTKAAALQVDENADSIGKGVFDIDVSKAKQVNDEIIKANLGENAVNYVVTTDVINIHSNQLYTAPNVEKMYISSPTVISEMKYQYNGVFIHRTITLQLDSASSLYNKNDI